jgi:hypothetical protein
LSGDVPRSFQLFADLVEVRLRAGLQGEIVGVAESTSQMWSILNVVCRCLVRQYGPPKLEKVIFTVLLPQVSGVRGTLHSFLHDKDTSRVFEATVRPWELYHGLSALRVCIGAQVASWNISEFYW